MKRDAADARHELEKTRARFHTSHLDVYQPIDDREMARLALRFT